MARKKGADLAVFKGREARLNLAIFETLATHDPQTTSDLQKKVSKQRNLYGTYYASLSKRIHQLEETGYVKKAKAKPEADSRAAAYELRPKAYLAMLLNSFTLEDLLCQVTDESASILLLALLNAIVPDEEKQQTPKA